MLINGFERDDWYNPKPIPSLPDERIANAEALRKFISAEQREYNMRSCMATPPKILIVDGEAVVAFDQYGYCWAVDLTPHNGSIAEYRNKDSSFVYASEVWQAESEKWLLDQIERINDNIRAMQ